MSVIHPLSDTGYVTATDPKAVQDTYKYFPFNKKVEVGDIHLPVTLQLNQSTLLSHS